MRTVLWIALLAPGATATAAATDGLDQHFGVGGVALIGTTPIGGHALARVHGLAVQSDGKFVLAAAIDGLTVDPNPQSTLVPAVVRLNADGSWDETFGESGVYAFPGSDTVSTQGGEALEVAVASDGSIIVAGETYRSSFNYNDVHSCTLLFRVGADGVIDHTFGNDGSLCFDFAPEDPGTTYFQHSASIAVGIGDLLYLTTSQTNLSHGAVARFTSSGALDASYGSSGVATGADGTSFAVLVLQPDQRVIATDGPVTYRFTESGVPDATFGVGGELQIDFDPLPTPYAQSAMLDGEGRLVSALFNGGPNAILISRIGSDGTLDTTFNGAQQQPGFPGFAAAPVESEYPYLLAAAPVQDRIFEVGDLSTFSPTGSAMLLGRLDDDASFDSAYGDTTHPGWTGLHIDDTGNSYNDPYGVTKDSAGRVLVLARFAGDSIGVCNGIMRFVPDSLFSDGLDPPPVRVCPP